MTQQHQKWIQLVNDKLSSEGMTQTHLARACGVKKPTISELLKYGKGSNRLKNRVCDVLGIDETWVDLGEQKGANMKPKRYPYSGKKKESNAILNITIDSKRLANVSNLKFCHMRRQLFGQ